MRKHVLSLFVPAFLRSLFIRSLVVRSFIGPSFVASLFARPFDRSSFDRSFVRLFVRQNVKQKQKNESAAQMYTCVDATPLAHTLYFRTWPGRWDVPFWVPPLVSAIETPKLQKTTALVLFRARVLLEFCPSRFAQSYGLSPLAPPETFNHRPLTSRRATHLGARWRDLRQQLDNVMKRTVM